MSKLGGKRKGAGRKPGSPNKATAEIRAVAGKHAVKAIGTLVDLMESPDTPAAARISAAKELLERGFGKSANYAVLELDTPISELSAKQAIDVIGDNVTNGKIAITEGQRLVAIIEARIKAVDLAEVDARLTALETQQ